ncbi:MAG: chorismate synthase [Nannocystaceae bacterium]
MSGNSIGERFRVTTFGESHGNGIGVVIDGCPAGHAFPHERVAAQLRRRRPGQNRLSSPRREPDAFEVLSGLEADTELTLGTPICLLVGNKDARSRHYDDISRIYRPSHADFTYDARFGVRAVVGGGRASARETIGRVAAGAVAESVLHRAQGVQIVAWVHNVGGIEAPNIDTSTLVRDTVDATMVRCPDPDTALKMTTLIDEVRKAGDSVGGVVRCVARNVPPGWGAPVFDKLSAALAGAMMSLPASRGFEIGTGFASTLMRGSEHNDAFYTDGHQIRTRTNHSGGIQGGISNGEDILISVAFKPVATIFRPQETVTREGAPITFAPERGRHDPCVLPRAVPMVESMMALVLCDHMLRSCGIRDSELGT